MTNYFLSGKKKDIRIYYRKGIHGYFVFEAIPHKRIFTLDDKKRKLFYKKDKLDKRLKMIMKNDKRFLTIKSLKKYYDTI